MEKPKSDGHIVTECPNRTYGETFVNFLQATNDTIDYIKNVNVCKFAFVIAYILFNNVLMKTYDENITHNIVKRISSVTVDLIKLVNTKSNQ